jgi:hypothetical protein
MADNRDLASLTGNAACDEVTHSGDTAVVQLVRPVGITGAEGAKSIVELVGTAGTAAAGVQTIQGIASGTPVAVSDNGSTLSIDDGGGVITVDGTVAVTGVATAANQTTVIGHLDGVEGLLTTIDADTSALAGAVSGTEVQVDVVTVPADPFGANADAAATAGSTGSIQAKLRLMTSQLDAIKTAVETIDNTVSGSELQVDIVSGSSSGTQYTEGDVDTSVTGTAVMWEDTSDTLRVASATKPLPVALISGGLTPTKAGTATLTNVSGATSSTTLQAANGSRLAVEIYNDSTAVLYVKYGLTASASSYTRQLQAGESFREELYTGIVTGIWASATGAARVTELTA